MPIKLLVLEHSCVCTLVQVHLNPTGVKKQKTELLLEAPTIMDRKKFARTHRRQCVGGIIFVLTIHNFVNKYAYVAWHTRF